MFLPPHKQKLFRFGFFLSGTWFTVAVILGHVLATAQTETFSLWFFLVGNLVHSRSHPWACSCHRTNRNFFALVFSCRELGSQSQSSLGMFLPPHKQKLFRFGFFLSGTWFTV